jgi:hypothetical protein
MPKKRGVKSKANTFFYKFQLCLSAFGVFLLGGCLLVGCLISGLFDFDCVGLFLTPSYFSAAFFC